MGGVLLLATLSALRVPGPLSSRSASYRIDVRLDAAAKTLSGLETLTWRNDGGAQTRELRFHLYLNAFKNEETFFSRESRGRHRSFEWKHEAPSKWGYVDVNHARFEGRDLAPRLLEDATVMALDLPRAVAPGETITLDLEFASKLPRVMARTGFHGDYFFAGQWFPKIGVFEDGRWNCHPFHMNSEFYADFGVYQVAIDVPDGFGVGASGVLVEHRRKAGRAVHRYLAEDVHDFAFVAAPFLRELSGSFQDVAIRVLFGPGNGRMARRHLEAARRSLESFGARFFPYPYRTLTVVAPPPGAEGSGGMEYPTLITTFDLWWMPRGMRLPEFVTVHEFGHQYFYGMLASNEFEEAWLDEGINSYGDGETMDRWFGRDRSVLDALGARLGYFDEQRIGAASLAGWDPIVQPAWMYATPQSYGVNTYPRSAVVLRTLENWIGQDTMARLLRTYTQRFRFKHPRTGDFLAVTREVAGDPAEQFLRRALTTTEVLDYEVAEVESHPVRRRAGLFERDGRRIEVKDDEESTPKEWDCEVLVHRRGELVFPVEVEIAFVGGERVRERWDGRERWKRFELRRKHEVDRATVDPDGKVLLDVNPLNDGLRLAPRHAPARRIGALWHFAVQTALQAVGL